MTTLNKNFLRKHTKDLNTFTVVDITHRKTPIYKVYGKGDLFTAEVVDHGGWMNITITLWNGNSGITSRFSSEDKTLRQQILDGLEKSNSEELPF